MVLIGLIGWVHEASLAGFSWVAFLRFDRPRGPGKAPKNVGGEAPHIFEGLPGPPGPARPTTGMARAGRLTNPYAKFHIGGRAVIAV